MTFHTREHYAGLCLIITLCPTPEHLLFEGVFSAHAESTEYCTGTFERGSVNDRACQQRYMVVENAWSEIKSHGTYWRQHDRAGIVTNGFYPCGTLSAINGNGTGFCAYLCDSVPQLGGDGGRHAPGAQ